MDDCTTSPTTQDSFDPTVQNILADLFAIVTRSDWLRDETRPDKSLEARIG